MLSFILYFYWLYLLIILTLFFVFFGFFLLFLCDKDFLFFLFISLFFIHLLRYFVIIIHFFPLIFRFFSQSSSTACAYSAASWQRSWCTIFRIRIDEKLCLTWKSCAYLHLESMKNCAELPFPLSIYSSINDMLLRFALCSRSSRPLSHPLFSPHIRVHYSAPIRTPKNPYPDPR